MIKIADNPVVRDQVKAAAPEASAPLKSTLADAPAPVATSYPATPLVLDNGRYYTAATEK